MDERAFWVALNSAAGIGPIRFQKLLQLCGSAEAAWSATDFELVQAGLERRSIGALKRLRQQTTPEQLLGDLRHQNITPVTLLDLEYPGNLRHVADPPPVLFTRGTLCEADALAVALVGTRRATDYGRAIAAQLAHDLSEAGITVVSGLAKGIDTVAHHAAIRAGGRTIAVLGNGLNQVYPPENRNLATSIISSGALITEFPPGIPPDAVNFPRRNRIISGLSLVTVIVEAGERSGALITSDFALEQGREVMAVPGSILSPASLGTNLLIKQGAAPVTGVDDILEALQLPRQTPTSELARRVPELSPNETSVWQALGREPRHVDDLARGLALPANHVSATLAVLELSGLARQAGPMLYTRA
jgi:DNA processing protein